MLPFYTFIDVPVVPKDLIEDFDTIEEKAAKMPVFAPRDIAFKSVEVQKNLLDWLSQYFNFPKVVVYVVFYRPLPLHIDLRRKYCFSYILRSGGLENTFKEDNNEFTKEIPLEKWYWFNTSVTHGTTGIKTCNRIILMVNPIAAAIPYK